MIKFFLLLGLSLILNAAQIEKELLYNKYTLKDQYSYGKKSTRQFQWEKINTYLDKLEDFEKTYPTLGFVANYKNINGSPALINGETIDSDGVPRNQAIPLYNPNNLSTPAKYGRDGSLVAIISRYEQFSLIKSFSRDGEWMVPNRYLDEISSNDFNKAIFIDRKNQNIVTMDKINETWKVRSMNPVTTGRNHPPFSAPTPLGTYIVQEKKYKMLYLKDGSSDIIEGYSPYAVRFTRGAYMHGIPVNLPRTEMIEYSPLLGTEPRSHMCVRNATSHAKFIYDWSRTKQTLVFVID
ncbi:MAG: L,D-transpeptidase [Cetobacterium sp.]|uniref:L,D-transpeptidase n=2 Tax=Cetobacterium sp. TaxID=2071632 RepID=UPI002FC96274